MSIESNLFCSLCNSSSILLKYHQIYNELICFQCLQENSDKFQQITATEIYKNYLLTKENIKHLKYETKRNQNHKYQEIKLYLKKDVFECVEKKFKSIENYNKIKEERRNKEIKRKLERVENYFVNNNNQITTINDRKNNENKKQRTKRIIDDIVSVIRGERGRGGEREEEGNETISTSTTNSTLCIDNNNSNNNSNTTNSETNNQKRTKI